MFPLLIAGLLVIPSSTSPDTAGPPSPVAQWSAYIDSLCKDDLDSFSRAITSFKDCCTQLPAAQVDSIFKSFQTFFFATISRHNDLMWENLDFLERLHSRERPRAPDIEAFLEVLEPNGLGLYTLGDLYYIDQRADYLYRQFYPYVSLAVKDYLNLRKMELAAGFSDDEMLVISYAQLGARIVAWDHYQAKYPGSIMAESAQYYYRVYLSTFLTGLRRSPVFGPEGALDPVVKRVYASFFRRHDGTRAARLVEDFYFLLAEEDFKWSAPIKEFYRREGIINMHTFQVPYR